MPVMENNSEDVFRLHFDRQGIEPPNPEKTSVQKLNLNQNFCPELKFHLDSDEKLIRFKEPVLAERLGKPSIINKKNNASSELFNLLSSYCDLFCCKKIPVQDARKAYCLHALNHALKSRSLVLSNNEKIAAADENEEKTRKRPRLDADDDESLRDQGLARSRVLILAPFRSCALEIVKLFETILFPSDKKSENRAHITSKKRFHKEFSADTADMSKKPDDFQAIFSGNNDDCFRFGVGISKKSLKLFVDFYTADVIIASPLGLRMSMGAEEETKFDHDFLAGIEVLIMEQTDVFLMQNWQHVQQILEHVNLKPKETRDTDFSRVRNWALDGNARKYRQTVVFSSLVTPEVNSVLSKFSDNFAGSLKISPSSDDGVVSMLEVGSKHSFFEFPASNIESEPEDRFEFFLKQKLQPHLDSLQQQILIFVHSYFDFVRIRNHFKKEGISFVGASEYTDEKKVSRARDLFYHGKKQFLVVTERFHFFHRYRIRGVKQVLFYQLPLYPHFYPEICGFAGEEAEVSAIFSKFDALRLAALFGKAHAAAMLASGKKVHLIIPEG